MTTKKHNSKHKPSHRRLDVGQLWSANFVDNNDGSVTTGRYTFKIVHVDRYYCRDLREYKSAYLAVKLNMLFHPHKNGTIMPQCWWFDEQGEAIDDHGEFTFILTRKKKIKDGQK